ncbi:MAG: iron-sulfur cluster assembly scaffold protein [Chloroflexi bacterium]|nr:iron-sulfur cluster assembly scaffold protein [Chloroflexota bacterium]
MYYSELALDHAESPRNVGVIQEADGIGVEMNPVCGDLLTLFIKVQDGHIADAKYQIRGCAGATAASSVLSELLIGASLEDAGRITFQSVLDALGGLPPSKLHSAALAEVALKKALAYYQSRGTR